MTIELRPLDPADLLKSPAEVAAFVEVALGERESRVTADALDVAARALGLAEPRLPPGADLETITRTLEALGLDLRLAVSPVAA